MIVIVNIFRSIICKLRKSKTRVQALYDVIVIGFHSHAHNNESDLIGRSRNRSEASYGSKTFSYPVLTWSGR